jgi:uncharacterized protein
MLIHFKEILPSGNFYEIREINGLNLQQDFIVQGSVAAQCTLKPVSGYQMELHGRLQATLVLVCDRCLSLYDREVDTEMRILFEVESKDSCHLKELEYSIPDLDTIHLEEPIIDLDDVLRQQLYLALPMKNLCMEQCRGICAQCGADFNHAECGCADKDKGSPFALLAQLKK